MSDLIPNRQLAEIRGMSRRDLVLMKSSEVYDGDEYVGTFITRVISDDIVATTIRAEAESLCERANSTYGTKNLDSFQFEDEEELPEPVVLNGQFLCDCGKVHRKASKLGRKHSKKYEVVNA